MPAHAKTKRLRSTPTPRKPGRQARGASGRRANVKRSNDADASSSTASTHARSERSRRVAGVAAAWARLRARLSSRRQGSQTERAQTEAGTQGPRAWQRRAAVITLQRGTTAALAWGLLVAGREVYEYATTSPRFEVQHFVYEPSAHVDDETLRELLTISPGTNILACDLAALSEQIVAHPWVASATVTRHMPDTLEVRVVEHEAAAIVLAGRFYLVNTAGEPFKQVERGERGELPIITGVDRELLAARDPQAGEVEQLVDALALVELYANKQRPRLGEIHLGDDDSVTLYTATSGTALELGREQFDLRLERWDALRVALGDRADRLAVVHLDHESRPDRRDRVVARFASERDEVVLLAHAANEQQQPEPRADVESASPGASEPAPARHSGRRNRIPSYE